MLLEAELPLLMVSFRDKPQALSQARLDLEEEPLGAAGWVSPHGRGRRDALPSPLASP